jgi:hypothetical protein
MLGIPWCNLNLLGEIRTAPFPLRHQSIQVIDLHVAHCGTGISSLVLRQMQHEAITRHLHTLTEQRTFKECLCDDAPEPDTNEY